MKYPNAGIGMVHHKMGAQTPRKAKKRSIEILRQMGSQKHSPPQSFLEADQLTVTIHVE
jgi:hypothetical protein